MNVLICDDHPIYMKEFAKQLEGYFQSHKIPLRLFTFTNGNQLLSSGISPDILFLDIKMEELSGLETARRLRKENTRSKIIFLTAYKQFVFQAFDVDASHYLIKPVKEEKLEAVLTHVIGQLVPPEKEFLTIQSGSSIQRLPYSDILYLEISDRKISVHTKTGTVYFYGKLEALEKMLPVQFFRCHRSIIVNMDTIMSFDKTNIFLANREAIPVSKRKYQEFSKAFMKQIQKEGLF